MQAGRGWLAFPHALQGRSSDARERTTLRSSLLTPSTVPVTRSSQQQASGYADAVAPGKAASGPAPLHRRHPSAHLGNAAQVVAGVSDAEAQDQG